MQIIIYDTEFTAWEGSFQRNWELDWESRELIQFAGIKIDVSHRSIEHLDIFSQFIQPQKNPTLSKYIQNLTGIKQTQVDMGLHPSQFFKEVRDFCNNGTIPIVSWGNDLPTLLETAQINELNIDWLKSHNLIPLFDEFGIDTQINSGQLYQRFNLCLELQEHNAMDDTLSLVASINHLHQQNPSLVYKFFKALFNSK
ncbi:3'-5' exonuclease [Thiosulfativibrio zosterae]|uniref:Exonuclease domain-containing protein n=1 Tax=Thiosulfativibrio zosterae TaxID=2675053 RepID=A0A6F8PM06_9GAMM|nr:3'-5' exonuclease [Thiosulfativibrio zosterae]BBP43077.1 hypothetical protein THMIRHAT_08230 [Thiosulfativibrio zosterae]